MTAAPYRKGAKAYRGLGLGQAIPVTYGGELDEDGKPQGPRPARRGLIGHDAQREGDLPRKREKAFRRTFGELNLGLHLADGVVSLDVDVAERLKAWLRLQGYDLPATPFSTARGADSERRQLVYRVEGEWSSNGLLPDKSGEVIDAGHRYVRAWPSIHKSGKRYHWYFPTTDDPFSPGRRMESPPSRDELAVLPAAFVRALAEVAASKDRARGVLEQDVDGWIAEQDHKGKPAPALRKLVEAVPTEGADNNQLMDLFGPLVREAWGAPGGGAAVAEGVVRYSRDHGKDAQREAMQAVGRAVGDYRAELDKRTTFITFPVDLPRTDARPTSAAPAQKSPGGKGKRDKGKKQKRAKKAGGPSKPPIHDRAYLEAKIDCATDDVLRAKFAASELADRLVFAGGKQAYQWTGKRWAEVGDSYAREVVRVWHEDLAAQMATSRPKVVYKVLTAASVNNTLALLHGLLARDLAAFDADPDLLNTPSGIVDLRTGELGPHDPAQLMTKMTRAAYVPGARHKDWTRALEALPEEARAWLGAKFGQGITGHMPDDDVMPVCQGGGENAKSTIFIAIKKALGDYAVQVPESLLQGERGAIPLDKMTLRGARVAIAEEASDDRRLNSKQIKDVLGTAEITARALYSPFVTFPATHSLFITTNHRLSVTETDWGTWRRLGLVIFPYTYVKENHDPEAGPIVVADPLKNQRPSDRRLRPAFERGKGERWEAVLAWLVDNAAQWYARGRLTPPMPQSVAQDTAQWRSEQDAILRFADERLQFGAAHFTSTNDLYQAFVSWLAQNGHPRWGVELFTARFASHEVIKGQNVAQARRKMGDRQVRGWDLVGLRPMDSAFANPSS